ncbi:MAG: transposase [Gammaproteobacteria bacterium]|nr:transposase [Gammaproteobacteria bacterium]
MTTKIHALVEGLGTLARWQLTAGQVHDITQAHDLIEGVPAQTVAADKAYDADALIQTSCKQALKRSSRRAGIAVRHAITISTNTSIATSSSAFSAASKNFAASPRATTNSPVASPPSSLWSLPSCGSLKCQQALATCRKFAAVICFVAWVLNAFWMPACAGMTLIERAHADLRPAPRPVAHGCGPSAFAPPTGRFQHFRRL